MNTYRHKWYTSGTKRKKNEHFCFVFFVNLKLFYLLVIYIMCTAGIYSVSKLQIVKPLNRHSTDDTILVVFLQIGWYLIFLSQWSYSFICGFLCPQKKYTIIDFNLDIIRFYSLRKQKWITTTTNTTTTKELPSILFFSLPFSFFQWWFHVFRNESKIRLSDEIGIEKNFISDWYEIFFPFIHSNG